MANAGPDPAGETPSPTTPQTVFVFLQCTMTQAALDHLFALGAARVLPADAPAPPWLAAAVAPAPLAAPPAASLSPSESEIIRLIGQGCTTAAIAKIRHRSPSTIEGQKSRLKKKLGLASPTALAQWAWQFVHGAGKNVA
jgi:DNA-binding CsgD family transcriptional regulator